MKFFGSKGSFLFLGLYVFFDSLFFLLRGDRAGFLFVTHHFIFMPIYSIIYFFGSLFIFFYKKKQTQKYKIFDLIFAGLGPLYFFTYYNFEYHFLFFFFKDGFNSERSIFELVFIVIGLILISIWYNINSLSFKS